MHMKNTLATLSMLGLIIIGAPAVLTAQENDSSTREFNELTDEDRAKIRTELAEAKSEIRAAQKEIENLRFDEIDKEVKLALKEAGLTKKEHKGLQEGLEKALKELERVLKELEEQDFQK